MNSDFIIEMLIFKWRPVQELFGLVTQFSTWRGRLHGEPKGRLHRRPLEANIRGAHIMEASMGGCVTAYYSDIIV